MIGTSICSMEGIILFIMDDAKIIVDAIAIADVGEEALK